MCNHDASLLYQNHTSFDAIAPFDSRNASDQGLPPAPPQRPCNLPTAHFGGATPSGAVAQRRFQGATPSITPSRLKGAIGEKRFMDMFSPNLVSSPFALQKQLGANGVGIEAQDYGHGFGLQPHTPNGTSPLTPRNTQPLFQRGSGLHQPVGGVGKLRTPQVDHPLAGMPPYQEGPRDYPGTAHHVPHPHGYIHNTPNAHQVSTLEEGKGQRQFQYHRYDPKQEARLRQVMKLEEQGVCLPDVRTDGFPDRQVYRGVKAGTVIYSSQVCTYE